MFYYKIPWQAHMTALTNWLLILHQPECRQNDLRIMRLRPAAIHFAVLDLCFAVDLNGLAHKPHRRLSRLFLLVYKVSALYWMPPPSPQRNHLDPQRIRSPPPSESKVQRNSKMIETFT